MRQDSRAANSPSLPLVRVGVLHPLRGFLGDSGPSLSSIVGKSGLARLPQDQTAFYPYCDAVTLAYQVGLRTGIEPMGYMLGSVGGLQSLGPYGDFIVGGTTLFRAIARANMMIKWISPYLQLGLFREGELMSWRTRHPQEVSRYAYQGCLHTLSLLVAVIRLVASPQWRPTEVRVGERRWVGSAMEDMLGCPLRFVENEWSVVFPRNLLVRPIQRPDWAKSLPIAQDLENTALSTEFTISAKSLLRSLLATGLTNEDLFIRVLGVPRRSFQRQFQQSVGMPFRKFVAEVRFEEARRLVAEPGNKLGDVAAALGYTEQANFTRAFSAWSGMSPSEYRDNLMASA